MNSGRKLIQRKITYMYVRSIITIDSRFESLLNIGYDIHDQQRTRDYEE